MLGILSFRRLPFPCSARTDRPLGGLRISNPEEAEGILSGQQKGYAYRRDGCPNADGLSEPLRLLHEAESLLLVAQGQSALTAVAITLLQPNCRVLLGQTDLRWHSNHDDKHLGYLGHCDSKGTVTDRDAWSAALASRPSMVVVETIANPTMQVADIAWLAEACRNVNCLLVVDNTFATPLLCRPMVLGADIVIESLTKLVSGHSDAMLGSIACSNAIANRNRPIASNLGLAPNPLDCWLTRRGLATLPLRFQRASDNALAWHVCVRSIPRYPKWSILAWILILSFVGRDINLENGRVTCWRFISMQPARESNHSWRHLHPHVPFCATLGDIQTTISHPASTSHRLATADELQSIGVSRGTIRISCGIEETAILLEHFEQALNRM